MWKTPHRAAGCAATWTAVIGAVCAGARAVRRLEIDPRRRRGGSRRRAVVSDAAGIQRVPGVRMESLRGDSVLSRGYPETSCALGGALQGRCERVLRRNRQDAGLRWRCRRRVGATEPIPEPVSARERGRCAAWKLTHVGGAGGAVAGPWSVMEQAIGCVSRARTHAAARRSPVRQDQARRSPPACVRARTPGDSQAGCRATLDTRPGARAGCAPHPASAAVVTAGRAACGTALAAAAPRAALDSVAVVGR